VGVKPKIRHRKLPIRTLRESLYSLFFVVYNSDGLVKSQNCSLSLEGEGWGEGENSDILSSYVPPPLYPLPPGEGKSDFLQMHQYCLKSKEPEH